MTVTGSNFLPASTIEWNGAVLSTTYLSEAQLETQIPTTNFAVPGFADVSVQNPVPGGGTSIPLLFTIASVPLVVAQASNDLAWDSAHQVIYLSVPSLALANGNTVSVLNPFTGAVTSSVFAGSEPNVLAISADDQFLYAGLDGASSVQRFTLPALVPDINYSLGADPYFGPTFAVYLQVAPGLSHTTVASRGAFNVSPYADCGMTIYDDGTPRPTTSDSAGQLYDSLQWGSDTAIYAVNSEITSFDFYDLNVGATGVSLSHDYQNEFSNFYIAIHYDSATKEVYTDDGYAINPSNGQHVGAFQATGLMIPDSTLNSAFFLGQTQAQFGTPNFTIEEFDLSPEFTTEILKKIRDAGTVYNFDTIDVDGKPEVTFKCLKIMVGERGFEPPTPWSRTRCSTRLSHSPTLVRAKGHPPALLLLYRHQDYNIATRPGRISRAVVSF